MQTFTGAQVYNFLKSVEKIHLFMKTEVNSLECENNSLSDELCVMLNFFGFYFVLFKACIQINPDDPATSEIDRERVNVRIALESFMEKMIDTKAHLI